MRKYWKITLAERFFIGHWGSTPTSSIEILIISREQSVLSFGFPISRGKFYKNHLVDFFSFFISLSSYRLYQTWDLMIKAPKGKMISMSIDYDSFAIAKSRWEILLLAIWPNRDNSIFITWDHNPKDEYAKRLVDEISAVSCAFWMQLFARVKQARLFFIHSNESS